MRISTFRSIRLLARITRCKQSGNRVLKHAWRTRSVVIWLVLFLSGMSISLSFAGAAESSNGDAQKAPEAMLERQQVTHIPSDPDDPVILVMTVFTPPGSGPFPLVVMNHGSAGDVPSGQQPRYWQSFANYYFLSRGYAVALPMMRGYGGSEGHLASHDCDILAMGADAAKDIRAAIDYMTKQTYIDSSRIVVAGESFGGWNALETGALKVPGVKVLVSFAGGVKPAGCDDPDDALIRAAAELGNQVSTPSIWFFGDNDQVFSASVWRSMYDNYTGAGAPADLIAYGRFADDSHNLLGSAEGLPLWAPKLDDFLARNGLPHTLRYPDYLPSTPPPPSHYADLTDLKALPYLNASQNDRAQAYYQHFLEMALPRALAIGERGAGEGSGGFDPVRWAMKQCEQITTGCRLYAVNNDVVWTRPTPAPPATQFAPLGNEVAVPYLDPQGRRAYEQFLAMSRPRAFAIAPDGGWASATLGIDPVADAIRQCNVKHHSCRLYAVDDDVVWTP